MDFLGMGLCVVFIAFMAFMGLPSLKVRTHLTEHSWTSSLRLCVTFIALVRLPSLKVRTHSLIARGLPRHGALHRLHRLHEVA
jgi:hypothetical protein